MLLSADIHIFMGHKNLMFDPLKTQCVLCWHTKIEELSPMLHYIECPCNILANNLSRLHCLDTLAHIAKGKKLIEAAEDSNKEGDKLYFLDKDNSVVVTKLSRVQTSLPITSRQASKSHKKSKKLHRNLVLNLQLDKASVTVIDYTMSIWAAIAILLTYSCSAPIMLPWVQQWRSDTFSPALERQSLLLQKWQILSTGCWHTQHYIISISASLRLLNLRKKHVCRKSNPDMPVKCTISDPSITARQGQIPPASFRVGIWPYGWGPLAARDHLGRPRQLEEVMEGQR
jgi:hypothetical protein